MVLLHEQTAIEINGGEGIKFAEEFAALDVCGGENLATLDLDGDGEPESAIPNFHGRFLLTP